MSRVLGLLLLVAAAVTPAGGSPLPSVLGAHGVRLLLKRRA